MPYTMKGGLNKDLEYVASKGLADLTREGLAPETTDSMLRANEMSDNDSIGEDTNVPPLYASVFPETGRPADREDGANMKGPAMEKGGGLSRK